MPMGHFGWDLDHLSRRRWTFQEFLLARRILFYDSYEVLFHCQSLGFTRLFPSYIKYPDDQQPSSRALFHSQDRIVAALEDVWNDKCVFGAWVSRFLEHMTWFKVAGFPFHPSLRRSNRAPSWSWLSIDGHVAIRCKLKLRPDCVITADLFEITKGARLTLSCRVIAEHEWPTLESNVFNIYRDIERQTSLEERPISTCILGVNRAYRLRSGITPLR